MSNKRDKSNPQNAAAIAKHVLGDLRVTRISDPFNEYNNQQKMLDAAMGGSSARKILDEHTQHQKMLDAAMGGSSARKILDEHTQHQKMLDAAMGGSSARKILDEHTQRQKMLDAAMGGAAVRKLIDENHEHQKILNSMTGTFATTVHSIDSHKNLDSHKRSQKRLISKHSDPDDVVVSANVRTPETLGSMVRQARKNKKLSQQEFADLAGVGRRFISELENGKATLEFGLVLQVCASAGIDILAKRR